MADAPPPLTDKQLEALLDRCVGAHKAFLEALEAFEKKATVDSHTTLEKSRKSLAPGCAKNRNRELGHTKLTRYTRAWIYGEHAQCGWCG
jgi:hypothetical protein